MARLPRQLIACQIKLLLVATDRWPGQ